MSGVGCWGAAAGFGKRKPQVSTKRCLSRMALESQVRIVSDLTYATTQEAIITAVTAEFPLAQAAMGAVAFKDLNDSLATATGNVAAARCWAEREDRRYLWCIQHHAWGGHKVSMGDHFRNFLGYVYANRPDPMVDDPYWPAPGTMIGF